MEVLHSALGTVFYTVVVFVGGALIGTPLWNWVKTKLPWNKCPINPTDFQFLREEVVQT